jgi:hypothetical protein
MNELEEPEVIPATRSPHGYLATRVSDNISVREEDGTLIVVGCPIARTGWQKYAVKDLPQERAKELGVDISNPNASIDLYRPASEVFHPDFLASLNGIPITDGHPPNGEFVNKDNFNKYAKGHIQNVRKGTEPLEDGEWPVIADLIISGEPLVGKVHHKMAREISLGYDFGIDRDGDKIIQSHMYGNHNAVVPDGRAGDFVAITDAEPGPSEAPVAEQVLTESATQAEPRSNSKEPPAPVDGIEAAYQPIVINFKSTKEKQSVNTREKLLRLLMGKHIIEMARATDADPEKIAEAAEAMHEGKDDAEPPKNTQANEFKSEDKKGRDGEVPPALKENEFKADDKRKAAHDALDRAMDAKEHAKDKKAKDKKHAKDADIEELKSLLDELLSEEEKEPEHEAADVDPSELEAVLGGGAEDCPDCGTAHDDETECPGETEVESGEEVMDAENGESPDPDSDDDQEDVESGTDKRHARDRARAADGATAVLRMLRPVVARSNDKAMHSAFNRALDSVKKSSRPSTGSYGAFAASARARDKAPRNPNPDRARAGDSGKADPMTKLQEMYNSAHKGGK